VSSRAPAVIAEILVFFDYIHTFTTLISVVDAIFFNFAGEIDIVIILMLCSMHWILSTKNYYNNIIAVIIAVHNVSNKRDTFYLFF